MRETRTGRNNTCRNHRCHNICSSNNKGTNLYPGSDADADARTD